MKRHQLNQQHNHLHSTNLTSACSTYLFNNQKKVTFSTPAKNLPHRDKPSCMGKHFQAMVFSDNFVHFMSQIYDVEWQYQLSISRYVQHLFDQEYEVMIELYEEQAREDLYFYLESSPRLWVHDWDNYPVYANRIIRYFKRRPYDPKDFVHLCVLLCSLASYFSLEVWPNAMMFAFVNIYFLTLRVLMNGTFDDSTW